MFYFNKDPELKQLALHKIIKTPAIASVMSFIHGHDQKIIIFFTQCTHYQRYRPKI